MKYIFFILLFTILEINTVSAKNISVLEFHHVVSSDSNSVPNEMIITVDVFEAEMEWLHDNGYITITASQLAEYMNDPSSLKLKDDDKIIVISFDDGYTDQLNAQFILKKYNFVATFNIISSKAGASREYMTWDQIINLMKTGNDIGSHTVTHPDHMSEEESYKEIIKSKLDIEQHIDQTVKIIAWPNGYFSKNMINIAIKANYIGALTIDQDWCQYNNTLLDGSLSCQKITGNNAFQNPFLIKRIFIDGKCSIRQFSETIKQGHSIPCTAEK